MPIHDRLDLDLWTRRFSLDKVRARAVRTVEKAALDNPARFPDESERRRWLDNLRPRGGLVDGPEHLAIIEQLRRHPPLPLPPASMPTDVFVWGVGEPPSRAATRIGGLPYRPADQSWPSARDGRPMDFLAQFCFADSRDLFPVGPAGDEREHTLPGDVLLMFCAGIWCEDWVDEPDALRFEWHPLGLTKLIDAADVPSGRWQVTPVRAQIHRTVDYPDPDEPGDSPFLSSATDGDSILSIEGSKIGGIPIWMQGDPGLPGRHLCTLASLNPFGEDWPLLNIEKNPRGQAFLDNRLLMFGDVGLLNITIDGKSRLHWQIQCA